MKIFLDANILIDIFDEKRIFFNESQNTYRYLLDNVKYKIFTSCDIITTLYYVNSKIDKINTLENIRLINKTLKIIEFSNKEIELTCKLMIQDKDFKDLENTIQYIMAKKQNCDLIISNDNNFVSKDIQLLTSKQFYNTYIKE